MSTFADALNEQIGYEFAASQQYIAIAVYYDAETLPQLAAHFYRQAVEERNHAMMMVQYLLDADEDVVDPGRRGAADGVRRRRRARLARARAGEARHRADRRAREARARGGRARRRAVPPLVPPGAARGGRVDDRASRGRRARQGQPAARRGAPEPRGRRREPARGGRTARPPAARSRLALHEIRLRTARRSHVVDITRRRARAPSPASAARRCSSTSRTRPPA